MALKKSVNKSNNQQCEFCVKIRLFLLSVIFIVLISLIFGQKIKFDKFINAPIIGNLILLGLIVVFSFKYYLYRKNKDLN